MPGKLIAQDNRVMRSAQTRYQRTAVDHAAVLRVSVLESLTMTPGRPVCLAPALAIHFVLTISL